MGIAVFWVITQRVLTIPYRSFGTTYRSHLQGPGIQKKACCPSTYLLTYSMVQSPSWEANWFAVSQQIPRISRNPKVHYRTHKPPPPVSILGQPNPVHIPTSHLLEIHPNIIHHLRLGLPSGLLPSSFPTNTLYTPSPHPYAPHAQPISFFSILSPAQYWVRRTSHLAPRYAICPNTGFI